MEENKTNTEMETTAIAEETNSEFSTEGTAENAAENQNIPEDSVTEVTSDSEKADSAKVIDLSDGESETKPVSKKTTQAPPKQKTPAIDFDIFIPRLKQLKEKSIESFSDEEIIGLALNKLTCDAYKSLKGIENTPAIACWVHLYNTVEDGDVKLAKAICNLKKDFPGAMKYMLDQIKKIGSGGFEHNELFEFVEKYYFTKDKPKKDAKKEGSKPVKTDAKPSTPAPVKAKEKKAAPKAKAKDKPFTTKAEKKDEPLQLSLLM